MVLAQDTDVLLLDEPTTFLDLHNQFKVLETVRQLNDRTGVTVAVVLHDVAQAARFADYLIALRDGQLYDWGRRRTSSPNSCSPTSSALRPPSSTSPSYRCCRGARSPTTGTNDGRMIVTTGDVSWRQRKTGTTGTTTARGAYRYRFTF